MSLEEPEIADHAVVALAGVLQRALAAHQAGKLDEAERGYYAALETVPNHPDALHLLGLVSKARGDLKSAKILITRAIGVRPDMAAQHYNLGNVLAAEGDFAGAAVAYREAVRVQPSCAEAWYALGNQQRETGDFAGAAQSFRQALASKPDYYEARHNLANMLKELGDAAGAVTELQAVLQQVPDLAEAHYNLALSHFMLGQYREGGAHYEWRWQAKGFTAPARRFAQPKWDGTAQPHKTLFVYAEQGLGDTLQFVRYLHLVRPKVAQLVVEVPKSLIRLLKPFADLAYFVPQGGVLPPFDCQIAMMSLPFLTGQASYANGAYLKAEPERVDYWREKLAGPGLKVGINWQGNPVAKIDKGRSFPLRMLKSLAQPGVRLVSLQKNAGVEQLPEFPEVETLGEEYDSGPDAFLDAAAVLENIDLFVTSDTALAHLAGALGRPGCVLLKHVPDWRWGLSGETCSWYPSLKLLRQKMPGDWSGPIASLRESLHSI